MLCFVGIAASAVFVAPAAARVYSPRPSGGGLVQNADGTYSLWGESSTKPLRTYSPEEALRMAKEDEALAVEAGETGQVGSDFVGGLGTDGEAAVKELVGRLRTGKPYTGPGELAVGDEVVAQSESVGTLATSDTAIAAAADAGPAIVLGGGVAYLGLQIGNSIDRVWGMPELFQSTATVPRGESVRTKFAYGETYKLATEGFRPWIKPCAELSVPGAGLCFPAEVHVGFTEEIFGPLEGGGEGWHTRETGTREFVKYSGTPTPQCAEFSPTSIERHLKLAVPLECYYSKEREEITVFARLSHLREVAFPAKGLGHARTANESLQVTPLAEGTVVTPPVPTSIPKPVQTFIAHEREAELPGVDEEGETEKTPVPVPDPFEIEIPKPLEHETGEHYVERLHELGFTNPVEFTLPETATDPRVGPGEVAYTSPAEGSRVMPDTTVVVETNPEDAPVPETGGGLSGPELPGLRFPNFGVLCTKFPFGVPCWLTEEFKAWSAVAAPPSLGWDSWHAFGHTIPAEHVSLAVLEPSMEVVRPVLVVISSIAIVLLFFRLAKGEGLPSGSNTHGDDD